MAQSKNHLIKFTAGIFFVCQIIGAAAILSCPLPALAQSQSESVQSLQYTPQVSIPDSGFSSGVSTAVGTYNTLTGKIDSTLLAQYIGAIYNYGLAIAGILATIMLMAAGVIWLTSGGDSGKVSQAKELISGSVAGLIILVVSWVILNTINPDLVNLKAISSVNIAGESINGNFGCCAKTKSDGKPSMTSSDKCASGFNKDKILYNGTCTVRVCCKQHYRTQINCVNSTELNCSQLGWESSPTTCENDSDCTKTGNYLISCKGVADHNHPTNGGSDMWCYNGIMYYLKGTAGEPCGDELYDRCDNRSCDWDMVGGRSCIDGVKCCRFDSKGNLIK